MRGTVAIDGPIGFQAWAFFNASTNELVISFSGTEGLHEANWSEFIPDIINGASLALTGLAPQIASAKDFIDASIAAADVPDALPDITHTGHSLGGFLARAATGDKPEGEVVVFNSPGVAQGHLITRHT